jgi:RNA polymerase sigma-70 factor (ECF subfamily)
MSYQDIAESMGLSVQAIKSLLSRARVNLKEILTPYVEQGTPPDEGHPPGNGQAPRENDE